MLHSVCMKLNQTYAATQKTHQIDIDLFIEPLYIYWIQCIQLAAELQPGLSSSRLEHWIFRTAAASKTGSIYSKANKEREGLSFNVSLSSSSHWSSKWGSTELLKMAPISNKRRPVQSTHFTRALILLPLIKGLLVNTVSERPEATLLLFFLLFIFSLLFSFCFFEIQES